jgi:hypothetical protein
MAGAASRIGCGLANRPARDWLGSWARADVSASSTLGIGVLYTVAAGLFRGARASVVAAAGCTLGIVPHMVAAGHRRAAALLNTSALAFQTPKYLGVAYLLYMAWSTRIGRRRAERADRRDPAVGAAGDRLRRPGQPPEPEAHDLLLRFPAASSSRPASRARCPAWSP